MSSAPILCVDCDNGDAPGACFGRVPRADFCPACTEQDRCLWCLFDSTERANAPSPEDDAVVGATPPPVRRFASAPLGARGAPQPPLKLKLEPPPTPFRLPPSLFQRAAALWGRRVVGGEPDDASPAPRLVENAPFTALHAY